MRLSLRNAGLTPGSQSSSRLKPAGTGRRGLAACTMASETTMARVHDDIWYSNLPRQQHDLRRNARAVLPRIEIEQAEVDLDVAVGRLNAAQLQNALAQARHARIVDRQAGQLQREVGLYRGADFRRALDVDVEAAVGKLAVQNRAHRLVDQRTRGRLPDAVLTADTARAGTGCNRIRAWYRRSVRRTSSRRDACRPAR